MAINTDKSKYCKKCMMPVLPKAASDSDVSFLFASMHCLCDAPRINARSKGDASETCKRCKKRKPNPASRSGSLTSFLFASTRCQCDSSITPNSPTGAHDLTSIVVPTDADRKKNIARTQMVQQNKTRMFSRTQTFIANDSTRAMMSLQPGQTIGGAYQLLEQIGEGGMGKVYGARHNVLARPCAIKFLMPEMVSEASWQMFKNEARILNSLNHEGICKIYDLGLHQNALPFLAMELIQGITLEQYLERFGPLSMGAALLLTAQAARTLAYAHRHNIVHRDLKPGNIMLAQINNNGDIGVKILDFGISQTMAQDESAQNEGEIVGSAFYMSPEQFRGDNLTASSDIYSVGCTLFECLTGRPPYDAQEYSDLSEMHQGSDLPTLSGATGLTMPPDLEAIISHCLQKHPIKRYKNMSELAVDCEKLLEGKALQFAHVELESRADNQQKNAYHTPDLRASLMPIVVGGLLVAGLAGLAIANQHHMTKRSDPDITIHASGTLADVKPGDLENAVNKYEKTRNKKNKTHQNDPIRMEDKLIEQEREQFLADKTTIGQLRTIDGKKYWTFDLPPHYEIGKITYRIKAKRFLGGPAHGRFIIPYGCQIGLAVDEEPGLAENLLPRINPDCLESITFSRAQLDSLQILKTWTQLKRLGYTRSKIGDQVSKDIAELKGLDSLFLDGSNLSEANLIKILKDKDLLFLSLTETAENVPLERVLPAILANKRLRYLSINLPDDKQVLPKLAEFKSLDSIKLHTNTVNERQVQYLSQLFAPKKVELDFDMPQFGPNRFAPLQAQYKNMRLIPSHNYAFNKPAIDVFLK